MFEGVLISSSPNDPSWRRIPVVQKAAAAENHKNTSQVATNETQDRTMAEEMNVSEKEQARSPLEAAPATASASDPVPNEGTDDPWAVPVPPPEDFLAQYRSKASELIKSAYVTADRSLRITSSGRLSTNLCEDLMYLLRVQVAALDEFLDALSSSPPTQEGEMMAHSDIYIEAVSSILHALYVRQIASRDTFLIDLEGCCAAANDFCRLSESLEEWADEIWCQSRQRFETPSSDGSPYSIGLMQEKELPDLIRLLVSDADYAVRLSCRFALDEEELLESGALGLFGREWEMEGTAGSSKALSFLLGIVEKYLGDVEEYIGEENLYRKAIETIIQGSAVVYVECLLRRAKMVGMNREEITKRRRAMVKSISGCEENCSALPFSDPLYASRRVREEIYAIKTFFKSWVLEVPAVDRIIEREFAIISALQECLSLAGDLLRIGSEGSCDFLNVMFEASQGNIKTVRNLVVDIWGLTLSQVSRMVVLPSSVEDKICKIGATFDTQNQGADVRPQSLRFLVPGFSVSHLLVKLYSDSVEPNEVHLSAPPSSRARKLSRRQVVKALQSDFHIAKHELGKLKISKKKAKKKARKFFDVCKQAGKLDS